MTLVILSHFSPDWLFHSSILRYLDWLICAEVGLQKTMSCVNSSVKPYSLTEINCSFCSWTRVSASLFLQNLVSNFMIYSTGWKLHTANQWAAGAVQKEVRWLQHDPGWHEGNKRVSEGKTPNGEGTQLCEGAETKCKSFLFGVAALFVRMLMLPVITLSFHFIDQKTHGCCWQGAQRKPKWNGVWFLQWEGIVKFEELAKNVCFGR